MNTLKNMEQKLYKKNNELKLLRQQEVSRLYKEFYYNDYGRRFETNKEKVLWAMVGKEHYEEELFSQKKDVKVILIF